MTDKTGRPTCFVVMPFRQPFIEYFDFIYAPAITDAGLEPIKGDDLFAAGDVLGQIWRSIGGCSIVLAELTLLNANVYYEIGLAHALKKPTILASQNVDLIPFDLRGGRCIAYSLSNPFWGNELRTAISRALEETGKEPLLSIPAPLLMDNLIENHSQQFPNEEKVLQLSIDIRLRQLQQSIEMLASGRERPTYVDPSIKGGGSAEELREVAEQLATSGMPVPQVIQQLVDLGASELWATRIAEDKVRKYREGRS